MNFLKKGPELKLPSSSRTSRSRASLQDALLRPRRTAPAAAGRRPRRRDRRGADRAQRIGRTEAEAGATVAGRPATGAGAAASIVVAKSGPGPARLPPAARAACAPRTPSSSSSPTPKRRRGRRPAKAADRPSGEAGGSANRASEAAPTEAAATGTANRHPANDQVPLLLAIDVRVVAGLDQRQAEQGEADGAPQPARADDAAQPRDARRRSSWARASDGKKALMLVSSDVDRDLRRRHLRRSAAKPASCWRSKPGVPETFVYGGNERDLPDRTAEDPAGRDRQAEPRAARRAEATTASRPAAASTPPAVARRAVAQPR